MFVEESTIADSVETSFASSAHTSSPTVKLVSSKSSLLVVCMSLSLGTHYSGHNCRKGQVRFRVRFVIILWSSPAVGPLY